MKKTPLLAAGFFYASNHHDVFTFSIFCPLLTCPLHGIAGRLRIAFTRSG
jgi:hypothetical protein